MASPSFTRFLSLPRWHSKWPFFPSTSFLRLQNVVLDDQWGLMAVSKKQSEGELVAVEKKTSSRTSKRTTARRRKKVTTPDSAENDPLSAVNPDVSDDETSKASALDGDSTKARRRGRRKVTAEATPSGLAENKVEKKVTRGRRTKKKFDNIEDEGSDVGISDQEGDSFTMSMNLDDAYDVELELGKGEEDDISFTYGWPPLVCCFGAALHAYVPSGRPANRLVDYEMQERMKDALWTPEIFVRAPGGGASSVAVALANLGGKVAFMGKVGDDDYGQSLLYYLNMNNVQTRSVRIDSRRMTSASQMKIGRRRGLRMTCVKPSAEDSLSRSEINIDVLKEAKMFYFNTFSLIDQNMRSTTLQAIKISKKFGGIIFYDLNLPLPLWQSYEETRNFVQQAWNLADVIEVTKQELEFLCGIKPSEDFDTKNNDRSKFIHYEPEVLAPLWHENIKVLFVTNGTSKIHYYTKEYNGSVLGMEDAPLSPFSRDMSAAGDGIVAALMRMLTVQPHLINDKGYLEKTVKYAVSCGVIDQWLLTRIRGFPPKEGMEENVEPDPNGIKSITEREYRTREPVV
ncbi:Fructokinase [Bertholletia excelsa]